MEKVGKIMKIRNDELFDFCVTVDALATFHRNSNTLFHHKILPGGKELDNFDFVKRLENERTTQIH